MRYIIQNGPKSCCLIFQFIIKDIKYPQWSHRLTMSLSLKNNDWYLKLYLSFIFSVVNAITSFTSMCAGRYLSKFGSQWVPPRQISSGHSYWYEVRRHHVTIGYVSTGCSVGSPGSNGSFRSLFVSFASSSSIGGISLIHNKSSASRVLNLNSISVSVFIVDE